jgi:hypothetical protein
MRANVKAVVILIKSFPSHLIGIALAALLGAGGGFISFSIHADEALSKPATPGGVPNHNPGSDAAAILSADYFSIADPNKFVRLLQPAGDPLAGYLRAGLAVQSAQLMDWTMNLDHRSARSLPAPAVANGLMAIASDTNLLSDDANLEPAYLRSSLKTYVSALRNYPQTDAVVLNKLLLLDFFQGSLVLRSKDQESGASAKAREKLINQIAGQLDEADRSAEEWGRATISDIAFIDNNLTADHAGYFALQYSNPTSFYMNQVRQNVQGTAAQSVSEEFSGALVAQYSPGAGALPSPAKLVPASASTNAAAASTNSAAASTNSTATATSGTATAGSASSAAGSLPTIPPITFISTNPSVTIITHSNLEPQLAEGTVTKIGASDKETELILDYMSDPVKLPDNKRAYLGVMQVSVLPGWRTKQGYIGEVQVSFQYALTKSGALKYHEQNISDFTPGQQQAWAQAVLFPGTIDSKSILAQDLGLPAGEVPTVISAFPFAESQIMDLSSSLQRQLSLLAQISASIPQVPGLAASLQSTFRKLTQQALNTRTSLPLVVPSSQGADVTYRFDPELQALVEPWNSGSGPGQILEPSSFPALIVIICDEDELLAWDSISASIETRWIPEAHRHWFKLGLVDWWYYGLENKDAPLRNSERLHNARRFDQIGEELAALESLGEDHAWGEASRRFENLQTAAMGRTLDAPLPLVRPHVTAIIPNQVRRDFYPTNILIQGRYFNSPFSPVTNVFLNGMLLASTNSPDGHFVYATISYEQWSKLGPGQYDTEVVSSSGKTTWLGKEPHGFTVLPTPAPVVTAVTGMPIREYLANSAPRLITVHGANFLVGDGSLAVAINHVGLDAPLCTNDAWFTVNLDATNLHLLPGTYDLTVTTSGGQSVLPGAVTVLYESSPKEDEHPPLRPPVVTSVVPHQFRQSSPPAELRIFGANFQLGSGVRFVGLYDLGVSTTNNLTCVSDREIIVKLGAAKLAATNYNLEVVNEAGSAVLTNAIQILAAVPPVVTAVLPQPVKINAPTPSNAPVPVKLTLYGQNFAAIDGSLTVAIGGIPLASSTLSPDPNDLSLAIMISTNDIAALTRPATGLKPGPYNLTVTTSGGGAVLTNAVQITAESSNSVAGDAPGITEVFPKHGFLYATSVFGVTGTNFSKGEGLFSNNKLQVLIGGRSCPFRRLSDTALIVTVPPWAGTSSTNDAALSTNKLDLDIIDTLGVGAKTNAIAFDLTLPKDPAYATPLTPQEQQIEKMLQAVFYTARVMGTNPVLQTDISLAATAGTKSSKTTSSGSAASLPSITATITINSNAVPATPTPTPAAPATNPPSATGVSP